MRVALELASIYSFEKERKNRDAEAQARKARRR